MADNERTTLIIPFTEEEKKSKIKGRASFTYTSTVTREEQKIFSRWIDNYIKYYLTGVLS